MYILHSLPYHYMFFFFYLLTYDESELEILYSGRVVYEVYT
jgi:hypothetical protein